MFVLTTFRFSMDGTTAHETVSRAFLSLTVLSTSALLALKMIMPDSYEIETGEWGLAFGSVGELLVGATLLYRLRMCELMFGSSHMAAFLVLSYLVDFVLKWFAQQSLLSSVIANYKIEPSRGPNALAFAILCRYWREIPAQSSFSIFGLRLSNKFFDFVLGLQLALSSLPALIAAIQGILIGLLFSLNLFYLRSIHVPSLLLGPVIAFCTVGSGLLSPTAISNFHQAWTDLDLRTIGSSAHAAAPTGLVPPAGRAADHIHHRPAADEEEDAEMQRAIQLSLQSSRAANPAPRH